MSSIRFNTNRESCGDCNSHVLCHHKIVICTGCNNLHHAKCAESSFRYDHVRLTWTCATCSTAGYDRYNPFTSSLYEKHNPNINEFCDDIVTMSNILQNCDLYDKPKLESLLKSIKGEQPSHLSIIFNNIDGNASNFDAFVADISQYNSKFDIISIAETNVSEEHKNLFQMDGYVSEYNPKMADKKKGTGVGIYINEQYQFNKLEHVSKCTKNLESLFIEITNTSTPQIVGVVYRPPGGETEEALNELESLLQSLPQENVSITGDFNIDLLAGNNHYKSEFEQIIYSHNYVPLISLATHAKPGCQASLIDNVLVNSTNSIIGSGILKSQVSHHNPVFSIIKCTQKSGKNEIASLPKYDYCDKNMENFMNDLETSVCQEQFCINETGFNNFVTKLNLKIDLHFQVEPSANTIFSKRNRFINPWITGGIIASVQTKAYLYDQWKKTCKKNTPLGDENLYLVYKRHREILCRTIKKAKKMYYSKKFELASGNVKKTWSLINELRGKKKTDMKASFIIDSKVVTERREIANGFNLFFSSIARKLNSKVQLSRPVTKVTGENLLVDEKFTKYYKCKNRVMNSIYLSPCDEEEIIAIIRELENGKASDISINLLKKIGRQLSPHLTRFFNWFLENGVFPQILKIGSITPIFKKGDTRFFDNYRPVSTLPIFGKILEKVIYSRLYSFFSYSNIIYDQQFGFRKKHSTCHAINISVSEVLRNVEKKRHVLGIFIDLSKAFDTIEHEKLLAKLEYFGVRGTAHKLLESYLTSRDQITSFQKVSSEPCKVEYGVPQGSVLGPLLFLLYINDIVNCSDAGKFILFADDTNIFVSGATSSEAYNSANAVLRKVTEYMKANKLHINVSKCCFIHFKPDLSRGTLTCARAQVFDRNCKLFLSDKTIKKVESAKFLGVIIDEKLNWEAHIKYLEEKLNSCIVLMKRIKKYVPKTEYLKIYNALFMSHLSYCISCWGGIPNYKLEKIFSIQKRCIRLLFGKSPNYDHKEFYETCARARTIDDHMANKNFTLEHTKPLFNDKGILNLQNLYVYHVFMETFKIAKFSTPITMRNIIKFLPRTDKLKLEVPLVKLDVSQQNFSFKCTQIWNEFLPKVLERCEPSKNGLIIPGSATNSDLAASSSFIKRKIRNTLLSHQKLGDLNLW